MKIYRPNGDQVEYHSVVNVRVGDVEIEGCSVTTVTPAMPGHDDPAFDMLGPVKVTFDNVEVSAEVHRLLFGPMVIVEDWRPH